MTKDSSADAVTTAFLDDFADAWNRHDVDTILPMMTPDCIYQQSAGPDVTGRKFVGHRETRQAIEELFAAFPDAQWNEPRHFIAGDRGVTEWVFTGTGSNERVKAQGCDVFTFADGKIAVKSSYRKQRTS